MEQQARLFHPELVVMMDEGAARELRGRLRDLPIKVDQGMAGIINSVIATQVETVVTAIYGRIGLETKLAAIEAGQTIALATKDTLPAVMNAANEIAVLAFLQKKITYLGIQEVVEKVCFEHDVLDNMDLGSILEADAWARRRAAELVAKFDARGSMRESRD